MQDPTTTSISPSSGRATLARMLGNQLFGNCFEATPGIVFLSLLDHARIAAGGEDLLGGVPLRPCITQCHERINAKGKCLLLTAKSIREFQSLLPPGVTRRCSPPPSDSLMGFPRGLALRRAVSVIGMLVSR